MSLDEFVSEEKKRLERFAKHYMERAKAGDPQEWPLEMESGDWDCQLQCFY
jgi:hypothetical protein